MIPEFGEIIPELHKRKIIYKIIHYESSIYPMNGKKNYRYLYHNLYGIRQLIILVKKWHINIIHTNTIITDIGAIVSLFTNSKHIWHIREMIDLHYKMYFIYPRLQNFLLKKSDTIICISQSVKNHYMVLSHCNNVIVIYNGINEKNYLIDRKQAFQNNIYQIILCGLLSKGKRQIDAIYAMHILVCKGYQNFRLTIVGNSQGNYIDLLKNKIKQFHLENFINIVSFQNDLYHLRSQADIALICSYAEAFGRVTVESMLAELLVIGADSGATSELLGNNERGYLYPLGNPNKLAQTLIQIINQRENNQKIIAKAKKYANQEFNLSNYIEKINTVYNNLNKLIK